MKDDSRHALLQLLGCPNVSPEKQIAHWVPDLIRTESAIQKSTY
jgi:hypothetical protein